MHNNTINKIQY